MAGLLLQHAMVCVCVYVCVCVRTRVRACVRACVHVRVRVRVHVGGCGWVGVKRMVLSMSLVDEPISDVLCT